MTVTLGANSLYFNKVKAMVPGLAGRRVYRDDGTLPQLWPGTQQGSEWNWWPGQRVVFSVRPDPAELAAGQLDAQVRAFVATAPPGSCLTSYHEAGSLDHGRAYADLSKQTICDVHVRMHELCRDSNVAYGTITCGPPAYMYQWVPGPGYPMDWYGVDIWDGPNWRANASAPLNVPALHARLEQNLQYAQERSGQAHPVLHVPETNSQYPAMRPGWMECIGEWMSRNGGQLMCTHWAADGPLSGDFPAGDTALITALNSIVTEYGP
jgi:hypothetical protein